MDIEYVFRVIDQAYEIPSIQLIVFTGGECTLFPEHLKASIEYAAENGFITRIVTNAWWASNYDKAREFLEELIHMDLKN